MGVSRQLPALDADNRAFWTGGEKGELRICFCPACVRYQHPPLPVCPHCGGEVEPRPVSGRAVVVSYSVNWQAWYPGQEVPFVLAMVELAEQRGLWLMTNIVDCPPEDVRVDMPLVAGFLPAGDVWLPVFRPGEGE